ncbi:MAG: DUF4854 domain-containing protein [Clostridia bacterium]|nr:DUF4854 domain-containing protein [Clostridia bacterium]
MKKLFAMLLALTFLITASACSNSNEQTADTSSLEAISSEQSSEAEESSSSNTTSKQPVTTSKPKTTTSATKPKPAASSSKTTSLNVSSIIKPIVPPISVPSTTTSTPASTTTSTPASTTTSTNSGTQSYRFETVEEMCSDPELKAQVQQMNEIFKPLGLEIEIKSEGNKLVYVYTFLEPVDAAAVKPVFEAELDAQKETFNSQVELLQSEIKNKMTLCVRYVNADGTIICEAEFPQ